MHGQQYEYITLTYAGDQAKPYPRIMLFTGKTSPTLEENFSYTRAAVDSISFSKICDRVFEDEFFSKDSMLLNKNAFQFLIARNDEYLVLTTPNLLKVKKIFLYIERELKQSYDEMRIKELLHGILNRIAIENKLR